ncbi:hypothetical protein [Clostridium tertium]|uniref:hypothetical protein n=1 Tax=Clostridium tertium TaxID=1559 RepID=UPI00241E9474|nr:hypothetical protein [Clostridium tertium]
MIIIKLYDGININELQLLGSGTQGKVYKIDTEKCIKIFKKKQSCRNEIHTLLMAQTNSHFPKIYSYGEKHIIREYIDGTELNKYLLSRPLTSDISSKIIEIYEAMYSIGFTRLDSALFHIFLTPLNDIKLIDTAKAMKKKTVYPKLIIKGLNNLGYKEDFLNFVETERPEIYSRWLKYCK